ncbi:glycoside hydrolase family 35 protein [Leifsonia sp. Root60]|uniref:glycoside hydrolase family 35 protein n=1 Tax=Leifsonia sp. Root60 TaxID=1736567 RepID=UPI0006FE0094|nr:beta-galactosidase family protein [Leifsonia sp. Root60]KRA09213.1 beta-galactosidase [Leifsonia sp. Root60]
MSEFTIGETDFLLDGRPHQVISGALHYFRVHPEQWADRIRKARLMGLNTIETYVAWNAHAPRRGEFTTEGGLDIARFLDLVAAEGMHAIVRPGPYICAEWDNGGLPAWLLRDPEVRPRSSEPRYLDAVTEYLQQVYAIVEPRQIDRGGPVVLVQIENEYGAYGSDKDYLGHLVQVTRDAGITVPLTTIDQPTPEMLADGSLPGLHLTASFGSRTVERFATLREHQPTGPLMCAEFWNGWFDSWGTHHHTNTVEQTAADLDAILSVGGSVNFYMFHGGTNFGLTSGANDKGMYQPIVTSYDYDAPLDEAGHPTEKYFAFRDVIAKYAPVPSEIPDAAGDAPALETPLRPAVSLFDAIAAPGSALGTTSTHAELPTFDDLQHDRGLALFTTTLPGDGEVAGSGILRFDEVRDRAWLFLDGSPVGILARDTHENAIVLPRTVGELSILVEDQGRVNYGQRIGEAKGLIGGARLDGVDLVDWAVTPLDLDAVPATAAARASTATAGTTAGPVIARGEFTLAADVDGLFLDTAGWVKGFVWVNGFLLGRYWRRGPQRTLFVPGPVVHAGSNEIVVLELEVLADARAVFLPRPELGHTEV